MLRRVAAISRPPPDLAGTADAYPHGASIILAAPALNYDPRPAYLSLNAHTYYLAHRNAEYLRSPNAAANILFRILPPEASVNRCLPATNDGPSWLEMMARYKLAGSTPQYITLRRRAVPADYPMQPINTVRARWGELVAIPKSPTRLVWVEAEVRRTWLGRLAAAVYKSPHVLLQTNTAGGASSTWQIVPGLGMAGFLLSPLVTNTEGFRRLACESGAVGQSPRADAVDTVRWTSPRAPKGFWEGAVEMRFFAVDLERKAPRAAGSE